MGRVENYRQAVVASTMLGPWLRPATRMEQNAVHDLLRLVVEPDVAWVPSDSSDASILHPAMRMLEAVGWWRWGIQDGHLLEGDQRQVNLGNPFEWVQRLDEEFGSVLGTRAPDGHHLFASEFMEELVTSQVAADDDQSTYRYLVFFSTEAEWNLRLAQLLRFVELVERHPDLYLSGADVDRVAWALDESNSVAAANTPSSWPISWSLAEPPVPVQLNPALSQRIADRVSYLDVARGAIAGALDDLSEDPSIGAIRRMSAAFEANVPYTSVWGRGVPLFRRLPFTIGEGEGGEAPFA